VNKLGQEEEALIQKGQTLFPVKHLEAERCLHKDKLWRANTDYTEGGKDIHLPAIYSRLLAEHSYQN
jgi:hypothetical protein